MDAPTDAAGFKAFEAEGWTRNAATDDRLTPEQVGAPYRPDAGITLPVWAKLGNGRRS
jgi:hypothetical protein